MIPLSVHLAFNQESQTSLQLAKDVGGVINRRGCDPTYVTWAIEESGTTAPASQAHVLRSLKTAGAVFVILGSDVGEPSDLDSPQETKTPVSVFEWEVLRAAELAERNERMDVNAFVRDGVAAACPRRRALLDRLSRVENVQVIPWKSDQALMAKVSEETAKFTADRLKREFDGGERRGISLTCKDKVGLLACLTSSVQEHDANIAFAMHTTFGGTAVIRMVAQWRPNEASEAFKMLSTDGKRVDAKLLQDVLEEAVLHLFKKSNPELQPIEVFQVGEESDSIFEYRVLFLDEPGLAEQLFRRTIEACADVSIVRSHLETFVSGGRGLGRIFFVVLGNNLGAEQARHLAAALETMPSVLAVSHRMRLGRWW